MASTTKSSSSRLSPLSAALLLTLALLPPAAVSAFPFTANDDTAFSEQGKAETVTVSPADTLQERVAALATDLHGNLSQGDLQKADLSQGLIVCTFVDLKKLYRTSSFGRYLAEQFMNAFQQRGYRVVELRRVKDVLVQEPHGEYGLSRDPVKINAEGQAGAMLTGTYMPADNEVVVNVRIIDLTDGSLLSTAAATFPRDRLIATLLRDSATASTGREHVTTVKRLEQ